ncbi:MAG: hypothetical protein MJE68_01855 [Proteobacteria bacterium]|nr:hypothetical protein [Pseudomonadota bacterium]
MTAIMKEVQAMKVTIARLMAEKVGWWRGVIAIGVVAATMFSTILGVTVYLDGKIEGVMDEVNDVREIAVRTEAKVDALIDFNIALQSGDSAAIDAAHRALIDLASSDASPATSDTSSDAPTTITTSYVITGEGLVVAPGDSLGDTLGEGENLIVAASQLGVDSSNHAPYADTQTQGEV